MILMCAPFLKTLNCNNFRLVQRVFIFQVIRIAKLFGLVQILEDKIISWQNYLCIPSMSTRNRCIQVFTRHNTHNLFQNKSLLLYIFYFLLRMERTGTKDSYTLFPSSVGLTFIFLTLLTFLCLSTYSILCLRNSHASIFIANLSISSPVQIHWSCLSILQYSC